MNGEVSIYYRDIQNAIVTINKNPETKIRALSWVAGKGPTYFKDVVKTAIHYENLGDWNKSASLKRLLVELSRLENSRPDLQWDQTVASTLLITLDSWKSKNGDFSEEEKRMHDWRAEKAKEILEDIAEESPAKVTGLLLARYSSKPDCSFVKNLLDQIAAKPLKMDQGTFEKFISIAVPRLLKKQSKTYAELFLRKALSEGDNEVIELCSSLLRIYYTGNGNKTAVKRLLDLMKYKKLGKTDEKTVCTFIYNTTQNLPDDYASLFLGKFIDEGGNNLIDAVLPLIFVMREPEKEKQAEKFLEKLKEKELGSSEASKKSSFAKALCFSLFDERTGGYAEYFLEKIIKEEKIDLIFFVEPLFSYSFNPKSRERAEKFLEMMKDKPLGKADDEELKKLSATFEKVTGIREREKSILFFLENLSSGGNNMVYFVPFLLDALKSEQVNRKAYKLLKKIVENLSVEPDKETKDKIKERLGWLVQNFDLKPAAEKIIKKFERKGITFNVCQPFSFPQGKSWPKKGKKRKMKF
ncbi:hypothetical protein JXB01_00200 [Candidatus Micrarchaeota archaeon]|nr:hypothetical protein [Candidatus Micrarchaeota archaeon]